MTRPSRYPQELRERAVRMVLEHRGEHPSEWAAISSIALAESFNGLYKAELIRRRPWCGLGDV